MKIKVTKKYLERVLVITREMKNYGTYKDLYECEKLMACTKNYLKGSKNEGDNS